jgi:hypothetical protein
MAFRPHACPSVPVRSSVSAVSKTNGQRPVMTRKADRPSARELRRTAGAKESAAGIVHQITVGEGETGAYR